jgi:predicted ATPase/DNA-binding CsgD family transcriptional regulator
MMMKEFMPIPLPFHLTDFVGREDDVAELKHLITTCRLVTLIGIGGIGKTRLALQVAAEVKEQFQDSIWLIEFASLSDPAVVPLLVASPFGIREQAGQSLLTTLIETLQSKRLLLILDNCEHVVAACAPLIASLLQSCAHLHVLVTSREALKVTGERLWWVAPLSFPPLTSLPPLEQLLHTEAVRLFCDRASAVNPRFTITSHNAWAVAQVCHRLDGIPLALELAAARMRMLSVEQLAERLNERFRLLTTGDPTAAPRQQTLQATLDWSYALLSPVEQTVLQRLSVFGGSWTLEAIEGICTDERTTPYDMLDILTQLVNKSLVIAEEYGDTVRYRLLETVQQYAYQQLLEAKGTQRLYMRHWQWYLQFVEHAALHLHSAQQAQWFQALERKEDNFRLALERSLEAGEITVAARIACALGHYWVTRSRLSEGRHWYETILAQPQLSAPLRAMVLKHAVEILRFQGEYVRVRSLLEERLALQRTLDASTDQAETLCSLGWTAFYQGDFEEAIRYCQEALLLFQQTKDQPGIAQCLSGLALVATLQGKYSQAESLLQEVIEIRRALHDESTLAHALCAQARVYMRQGKQIQASQACREALTLASTLKQPFGVAYSLEVAAEIANAQGDALRAVHLFGAAHVLRASIGTPLPPSLQAMREHDILSLRVQLGEGLFAQHWAHGEALSRDQARIEAEEMLADLPHPPSPSAYPAGLSQREVEVLRLVAAGLTDAQVAQRLMLSPRTVSTHLRSIYNKLGVTSRHAATRFALDHRLT